MRQELPGVGNKGIKEEGQHRRRNASAAVSAIIACKNGAINPGEWTDPIAIQEKIVEYCHGLMKGKEDRMGFMTFVIDFTPLCDCAGWSDSPVVPDIGVVASRDIVAIDQACADLVNAESSIANTRIKRHMGPGDGQDPCHARFRLDRPAGVRGEIGAWLPRVQTDKSLTSKFPQQFEWSQTRGF